jgi:hypothetical protein
MRGKACIMNRAGMGPDLQRSLMDVNHPRLSGCIWPADAPLPKLEEVTENVVAEVGGFMSNFLPFLSPRDSPRGRPSAAEARY